MLPKRPANILSSHASVMKTNPTGCAASLSHMIPRIQMNLIEIQFDDGTKKVIDFEPWLTGPIFRP